MTTTEKGSTIVDGATGGCAESNMRIWNALCTTDPDFTKPVEFGSRKFTSIDPMWQYQKMTEMFGPIGEGWGWTSEIEDKIQDTNGDWAAIVYVSVWWSEERLGEDFVARIGPMIAVVPLNRGGRWDKDSGKCGITDSVTKLLSHLGVSADVFLGKFDDNAYVDALKTENGGHEQATRSEPAKVERGTAKSERGDDLEEGSYKGIVSKVQVLKQTDSWTMWKVYLGDQGGAITFDSDAAALTSEAMRNGEVVEFDVVKDARGFKMDHKSLAIIQLDGKQSQQQLIEEDVPF